MRNVDRDFDRNYKSMNPTDPLLAIGFVVSLMSVLMLLRWLFH